MDLVLVALPDTGLRDVASILERAYRVRIDLVEMDLTDPEGPQRLANLSPFVPRGLYMRVISRRWRTETPTPSHSPAREPAKPVTSPA